MQVVNKIDEQFIKNVEARLEKLGWNVPKLAAELKTTRQYVYKILKSGVPNTDLLAKICDALGVSPSDLLGASSVNSPTDPLDSARIELIGLICHMDELQVANLLGLAQAWRDESGRTSHNRGSIGPIKNLKNVR